MGKKLTIYKFSAESEQLAQNITRKTKMLPLGIVTFLFLKPLEHGLAFCPQSSGSPQVKRVPYIDSNLSQSSPFVLNKFLK